MEFYFVFLEKSTPKIIFSIRHELRSINLHTLSSTSMTLGLKNTIALDFLYFNNTYTLFWTDVVDDKIFRGTLEDDS